MPLALLFEKILIHATASFSVLTPPLKNFTDSFPLFYKSKRQSKGLNALFLFFQAFNVESVRQQ